MNLVSGPKLLWSNIALYAVVGIAVFDTLTVRNPDAQWSRFRRYSEMPNSRWVVA